MAVTKTLPSQPASVTDNNIDLWVLDRTKWVIDGPIKTEGRTRSQSYTFNDGDSRYPLRAVVRQQIDGANAVRPLAYNTVTLYPTIKKADDVAEVDVADGECAFGMFFNVPADNTLSEDVIYAWLTATLAAFFKTATAGVGDKDTITALARRVLSVL